MNIEEIVEKVENWVSEHQSEIVNDLVKLLRIPSQSQWVGNGFTGAEEALECVYQLGQRYALDPHIVDRQVVYLTVGEAAKPIVSALCHVDVVERGVGWDFEEDGVIFRKEYEKDGAVVKREEYVYGRGAIDDKGPTIACVHALRAIKKLNIPLKRRVRLIVGGEEEIGGGVSVPRYLQATGEKPEMGIVPDSRWPLVIAEKGRIVLKIVKKNLTGQISGNFTIESITTPNTSFNVVPDDAQAQVVRGGSSELLRARGKAAHASRPTQGVNAIAELLRQLMQAADDQYEETRLWRRLSEYADDITAGKLSIQPTALDQPTACFSIIKFEQGRLEGFFDIRYPADSAPDEVEQSVRAALTDFEVEIICHELPLLFSENEPPVQTVLSVYRSLAGRYGLPPDARPYQAEGRSYASELPRHVPIGAYLPHLEQDTAHQPNERISIESLKSLVSLYACILVGLANAD